MVRDQKCLFQTAHDNPWHLFTGEEISMLCNVGEQQVRRARNAPDSPFRSSKCRPEWFIQWMLTHPEIEERESAPPPSPIPTPVHTPPSAPPLISSVFGEAFA